MPGSLKGTNLIPREAGFSHNRGYLALREAACRVVAFPQYLEFYYVKSESQDTGQDSYLEGTNNQMIHDPSDSKISIPLSYYSLGL